MVYAHVSPGIYSISRLQYNKVIGVQKQNIMHSVRELLTNGKWVQCVSLHIVTSSLREVIPKIQNKFNYSCIVDCRKIFQSLISYHLKGLRWIRAESKKVEIKPHDLILNV